MKKFKNFILIIMIILLIFILVFLFNSTYISLLSKKNFENSVIAFAENNQETIFSIDQITFFSSGDSKNKTSSSSNFSIENLYAFTDIALYINNNSDKNINDEKLNKQNAQENKNTLKNTIKSLKLTNIKISKEPELGTPSLYYKSINNFAKSEISEENKIQDELEFEVTSEPKANLDKPILYNNCANPITISYVNQNIKTDYTMIDTENPIIYNGKLLERCKVELEKINASISFDVEIENNKNQKFRTTVYFDIPYTEEEKSIYDGSIVVKKDCKFNFYRYE